MRFLLFFTFLVTYCLVYSQHLELCNPQIGSFGRHALQRDSIINNSSVFPRMIESEFHEKSSHSWVRRKMFEEHFTQVHYQDPKHQTNFYLEVDPIFNFQVGRDIYRDRPKETLYTNTRGIRVAASLNNKFGIVSEFYENQSRFPTYLSSFIDVYGVVPGQGRVKDFNEGDEDYAFAIGQLFYRPTSWLSLYAGHGKNKIGEGYRSIFLSENSFVYPYFRIDIEALDKRLTFTQLTTSFQELFRLPVSADTESPFLRRAGNFHYVSYRINNRLRAAIVDGIVMQNVDRNGSRGFYWDQISPIPILSYYVHQNSDDHYSFIGLELSYLLTNGLQTYFQAMRSNAGSYGGQFGIKWWKANKWMILAETNISDQPYRLGNNILAYGHYNQNLGLQRGYENWETAFISQFQFNRVFTSLKFNMFKSIRESNDDVAIYNDYVFTNRFVDPQTGVAILDQFSDLIFLEGSLGYFINRSNGMQLEASYRRRLFTEIGGQETQWISLSFRTYLPQSFYDF